MIGTILAVIGLTLIFWSIKKMPYNWDEESRIVMVVFSWILLIGGLIWSISVPISWAATAETHKTVDINIKNKLKIIEKTKKSFREMTTTGTEINIDMVNKNFHSTIAQQYNDLNTYVTKYNEFRARWRVKYKHRFFSHCWSKPPEEYIILK